ncbi:gamma-glutamyl-gamma-aminobutyrate hydrolase family protein [Desulfobaculum xiamenense]|nr:gamma-glutamyl-gamma-aminobutyrate hydrolase family protein [Desulfobaculum xiamenense]
MKVAVSQRVDVHPNRDERRDALDQRMVQWLCHAGCMSVPVPNGLVSVGHDAGCARLVEWLDAIEPEAILLSGGNDLGEAAERDVTERFLLDFARERHLPVLGICRGMQMMGVWGGAGISPISGHVRIRHLLCGAVDGEANSFHTMALRECPQGFSVLARSEDGVIEAMRHDELPWEGWMWHPERELNFSARDIARVRTLFGL